MHVKSNLVTSNSDVNAIDDIQMRNDELAVCVAKLLKEMSL